TFSQRLRYAFDRSLSGGTVSLIGWLALGSVAIVMTATAVILLTGLAPAAAEGGEPQALGFAEAFWQTLTYGEALLSYENCSLMGLRLAAGGVRVNPPKSEAVTFQPEDRIIVLAED